MSFCTPSRRGFIASALATVGAVVAGRLVDPAILPGSAELTLFDHRYDRARDLALQIANGGPLQAMGADPTEIALWLASRARSGRTRIQGVTTESVPFCLRHMNPRARLELNRIDRDLFTWVLRSPGTV